MKILYNCQLCNAVTWSGKLCDECFCKIESGISRPPKHTKKRINEQLVDGGMPGNIEDGISLGGRTWRIR